MSEVARARTVKASAAMLGQMSFVMFPTVLDPKATINMLVSKLKKIKISKTMSLEL